MFGIGPLELLMILVVALLVFGPKRVPELARTLGKGLAEFRRASNDLRQSLALDDLQQDLRRNLTENQTIHRPTPSPEAEAPKTEAREAGSEEDTEDRESTAPDADSGRHPGELPLDNDHEHHDEAAEPETPPVAAASSPADPGLGNVPVADPNPSGRKRG